MHIFLCSILEKERNSEAVMLLMDIWSIARSRTYKTLWPDFLFFSFWSVSVYLVSQKNVRGHEIRPVRGLVFRFDSCSSLDETVTWLEKMARLFSQTLNRGPSIQVAERKRISLQSQCWLRWCVCDFVAIVRICLGPVDDTGGAKEGILSCTHRKSRTFWVYSRIRF